MTFTITELNVQTGKLKTREMTAEEAATYELEMQKSIELANQMEEQETAKKEARASAIQKLSALGLTEAEIQALAG